MCNQCSLVWRLSVYLIFLPCKKRSKIRGCVEAPSFHLSCMTTDKKNFHSLECRQISQISHPLAFCKRDDHLFLQCSLCQYVGFSPFFIPWHFTLVFPSHCVLFPLSFSFHFVPFCFFARFAFHEI